MLNRIETPISTPPMPNTRFPTAQKSNAMNHSSTAIQDTVQLSAAARLQAGRSEEKGETGPDRDDRA